MPKQSSPEGNNKPEAKKSSECEIELQKRLDECQPGPVLNAIINLLESYEDNLPDSMSRLLITWGQRVQSAAARKMNDLSKRVASGEVHPRDIDETWRARIESMMDLGANLGRIGERLQHEKSESVVVLEVLRAMFRNYVHSTQ